MEVIIKSSLDIQLREKKERVEELEEIIESNTAKYGVMIHEELLSLQKKLKKSRSALLLPRMILKINY
jgi:hypothetical protein